MVGVARRRLGEGLIFAAYACTGGIGTLVGLGVIGPFGWSVPLGFVVAGALVYGLHLLRGASITVHYPSKVAPPAGWAMAEAEACAGEAVARYGERQCEIAIEEAGELVVALQHHRRGRAKPGEVVGEVADALLTALELRALFGAPEVDRVLGEKVARLRARIASGAGWHGGPALRAMTPEGLGELIAKEISSRRAPPDNRIGEGLKAARSLCNLLSDREGGLSGLRARPDGAWTSR